MDEDFRDKELFKQRLRREERQEADERRKEEQRSKRWNKESDDEKRHQLALERQQLRAENSRQDFNHRNHLKKENETLKNNIVRANHTDSLEHSVKLSQQEHNHQLKRDAQQRQHEINVKQGELRAEQLFIQERLKIEKEIQENRDLAEHQRAEMLAEWDYQQALSTQQEITTRDIAIAREQTERELALAKENNNQALVKAKFDHLALLEQKAQELSDYEARVKADTEALRIKEDEALDRRLTESRHNFGQDLQKLHAEFLRMKLEEKLKEKYFTHEQETLLRMRKLARDLGLDYGEMSADEISEMIMDFESIDRQP